MASEPPQDGQTPANDSKMQLAEAQSEAAKPQRQEYQRLERPPLDSTVSDPGLYKGSSFRSVVLTATVSQPPAVPTGSAPSSPAYGTPQNKGVSPPTGSLPAGSLRFTSPHTAPRAPSASTPRSDSRCARGRPRCATPGERNLRCAPPSFCVSPPPRGSLSPGPPLSRSFHQPVGSSTWKSYPTGEASVSTAASTGASLEIPSPTGDGSPTRDLGFPGSPASPKANTPYLMKRQYQSFMVPHGAGKPSDIQRSGSSFVVIPRRESMVATRPGLVLTNPRTTSMVVPGLPTRIAGPVSKVWRWLSSPRRHTTQPGKSPRSLTGRPLLNTQENGKYKGINENEALVDEENFSQSDDEGALCKATIVLKRPHAFYVMVAMATALIGMSILCFWIGGFLSASSPLESSSAATDAAAAALSGSANSTAALRARGLTEQYIQLRFANNLHKLEALFDEDIKMHVDLSKAGMLVRMKIKSAVGLKDELSGKAQVVKYYRDMPTEEGDEPPKTPNFKCIGNACVVTCTVQRPVVGSVTDVGTLHWDAKEDLLREVDLSFWTR